MMGVTDTTETTEDALRRIAGECERYRLALVAIDNLDPRNFEKSFFGSFSGGPETDFRAAFKAVCRIVNGVLHGTDENGRPLDGPDQAV
jgi:hypothetical protein